MQQVVDVFITLLSYTLSLVTKYGVSNPLLVPSKEELTEAVNVSKFAEVASSTKTLDDNMKVAISLLCDACRKSLLVLASRTSGGREFFDVLKNVLFLQDEVVALAGWFKRRTGSSTCRSSSSPSRS